MDEYDFAGRKTMLASKDEAEMSENLDGMD